MEEKDRKPEERSKSSDIKQIWEKPKFFVLDKEKTEGGTGQEPTESGFYPS